MKKTLLILGMVVLVVAVAAGSFYGGMIYQKNQANQQASQAMANWQRERGSGGAQAPGGASGQMPSGPGGMVSGFMGRGTTGDVKTIDGDTLTISTAQNVTTVKLTDATKILMTVEGSTTNLQVGTRIMITGQTDSKGVITASQITVINTEMMNRDYPAP